jgi:hypothetical protein
MLLIMIKKKEKNKKKHTHIHTYIHITLIQQSPMHLSFIARYFVGSRAKSLYKGVFRNFSSHTHMPGVNRLKTGHYGYLKLARTYLRTCTYNTKYIVCVCVCVCIYTHTHTHTYTYIHTVNKHNNIR